MLPWIRPKELQQHYQESQRLFALPDTTECSTRAMTVLNEAFHPDPEATVEVQPHVLNDAQVIPWLTDHEPSHGTRAWLSTQLHHPTHSIPRLKQRQADLATASQSANEASPVNDPLVAFEPDVLWALQLPPIEKAWPLPLLFPQWFALRWINHQPQLLNLYQLYRIYGAPLSHFIYPLTLFFAPWWYIRTKLKWKLPFTSYVLFIKKALTELLRFRSASPREILFKITTLVVYVGLYIYGLLQTLDITILLHQTRKELLNRLSNIQTFLRTTESRWLAHTGLSLETWWIRAPAPETAAQRPLPSSIQGMYQLFKSPAYHAHLKHALLQSYTLRGLTRLASVYSSPAMFASVQWRLRGCPLAEWRAMGHPMLPPNQQRNPVSLQKNLILTGPNAAGKSTYVRSILANMLLAQTFGVVHARKAVVSPVHTIASFMRVQDIVGTQSLFEAECRRSLDLIRKAQEGHPVLFFLDEPMNATPPTEGAATAMALIKYLATFPNVRLITTTHYHLLAELETEIPTHFRNISMEATADPIRFTYKLRPGACFQSIALELLEKDAFPEALLKDAIKIKNKICRLEDNTPQPPTE